MEIQIINGSYNLNQLKFFENDKSFTILDLGKFTVFSPLYPHGDIPIPGREHGKLFSQTVEGIWQGLKIFEGSGQTESMFDSKDIDEFE